MKINRMAIRKVGFSYGNHYKRPNKKENWPKSFPGGYLRTSDNGVLYGHSERSGVLYGKHINIVSHTTDKSK